VNDTLIGVISCERDKAWLSACRDTWLSQLPDTMDFVICDASVLPQGVTDRYESLPLKTKALARYAFQRGYRNLLKVDVDTYLRPKLLVIPNAEYAGRWRGPSAPEYVPEGVANECDYVSGGAYWLTRRAIQIIAEAKITNDPAEDRWVGNELFKFGIRPHGLPYWIAPTHIPVSDYLKNPYTVLVMQMETPQQMRNVHVGKFDPPRTPIGSRPEDYPVGSLLRNQMR
jgi:hypothetical protein